MAWQAVAIRQRVFIVDPSQQSVRSHIAINVDPLRYLRTAGWYQNEAADLAQLMRFAVCFVVRYKLNYACLGCLLGMQYLQTYPLGGR